MLRKILVMFAMSSMLAGPALAQNGRGRFETKSTVSVAIEGLTCDSSQGTIPALSWSFGVTVPTTSGTSGGGVTGKAVLTDLNVTRRADSCTPILFGASVTGKVFKQVTIVQQDTQKDDVFTVTLQDVIISSYQLGGDQSNEVPGEQLGFSYRKICVADSITGSKGCWDLQLGRTF
jgi:type VI secretion system Hcp family effector